MQLLCNCPQRAIKYQLGLTQIEIETQNSHSAEWSTVALMHILES